MASDSHIKFDGVEGESAHADHKGEIEVLSWHWGVNNAYSPTGTGGGVGKANFQELSFQHAYDKASPNLAKKCAGGEHFPTATLTCRKTGGEAVDFLKITMKKVFITSVSPGGSSGGDLMESVTVMCDQIEFEYKPQDDKGKLGGPVKFGYDIRGTKQTA